MWYSFKMEIKSSVETKIVDISVILEIFGKYQLMQYTLICLPTIFVTMININYVFVAGDTKYRCRIDECEGENGQNIVLGANSTGLYPSWWPDANIDRCSAPVLDPHLEPVCTNNSFTGELTKCDQWIYENNNTIIAELNLACQPWKSNLIGTIHSTGMLVSMVIGGWMSDRFGRKPTLLFCVVGGSIGLLKTFATTYYVYVTIEFFEAAVTGGSYSAAMVILLEIASSKHRLLSGVLFAYAIYVGECMFAVIAMFVPYWKNLIYIISGPLLFFTSYVFLIYESPRWQIVSGRLDKAKTTMKRIAEINKINIDYEELAAISDAELKEKFNIEVYQIKESYKEIFTSKSIVKRLLVVGVCRFTSSFVYYGLMINSVFLPGDKYINFLLSTVMSFPGEMLCLYLMNKYGRKIPLMVGYIICGTVCVVSALIPPVYVWAKITMFLLGKVVIAACFTGAITYTMELFPTSVRGTLLGLGSVMSRFGGMLAPLTPILYTVSVALPSTLFGCFAVLSGILLCLTPETKGMPLLDSIKQVEQRDREKIARDAEK